ncbi:ATP/maltotriose-dependent transcriptional regulator MalT [Georgenia soli]|uniref:ATP/maltotriose-dependent transcriptional regulator MalT n=1 Tax=Georgenia soli TaxID=638953 RepID=A0A2A9EQC6_9MICO|nr:ATP/maltotriose-dependent transcriptional regulator MalT [Georgenia soli]
MSGPSHGAEQHRGDGRGLPRVPAAFTPSPAAERALQNLPPLVVLQAPRGYGKTTTASAWLRRPDLPDHDLVWVGLPPRAVGRDEFWSELHDAVVRAGYDDPGPVLDGRGLGLAAQKRFRHLVIVVDSFERLTDESVDEELVDLAQRHENLHLVLLTRTVRPVVSLARAAAPEAVVLQPSDFVLTPDQVRQLGEELGVPVTERAAAALCTGLSGWPGLVRVALLTASFGEDGEPVVDLFSIADYLRIVLQDLSVDGVDAVLTSLAVPESFTPELAEQLVGAENIEQMEGILVRMRRAGLLVTKGEGTFAYPVIIRDAANLLLREDDPARYWRLNADVARLCRGAGQFPEALEHAMRSQDAELVAEVVEESWQGLLAADRGKLRDALGHLQPAALAGSPTMVALRDHVAPPELPRWFLEAVQSDLPVIQPGSSTLAIAHDEADEPGVSAALLELAHVLLGEADTVGAAYACYDAVRRATDDDERLVREAGAGVALTTALLGQLQGASHWMDWVLERPDPPPGPLETVARIVVPAFLRLDRLDDVDLPERPPDLPESHQWLETLVVYVWVGRSLHLGRPAEVLGDVEQYRDRNRHRPGTWLGQSLLSAALIDLCIATDQLARGREIGNLAGPRRFESGLLRAALARLALYSGDDQLALDLTRDAPSIAPVRPRVALKLSLVRTVAAHRTGQRALAQEAMHLATRIVERTGMLRPFLLVPRADLENVAAGLPQSKALLEKLDEAAVSGPFPEAVRVEPLSGREIHVLRELATGRPVPIMARRLFVSESTVKTQVRSIYRKLGVHSRAEALERGRLLGLLPPQD